MAVVPTTRRRLHETQRPVSHIGHHHRPERHARRPERLDTTAHNIANAQTPGFRRQRIEQSALPQAGGVETRTLREDAPQAGGLAHLAEDLVAQRMSVYSFSANLKTVQTEDRMLGSVLDQTA